MFFRVFLAAIVIAICYFLFPANSSKLVEYQSCYLNDYIDKFKLIEKKGGWGIIEFGKPIYLGMVDSKVKKIKKRLFITGELSNNSQITTDTFDSGLEKAVKLFQRNHTIKENGIVDAKTIKELNMPVSYRIRQLEVNVERWKEFTFNEDSKYIFVNVAGGKLDFFVADSSVIDMKIIVGRYYRKTPVFNADLSSIVFNPYWFVPPGIMQKDILPKLKKNMSFFNNNDMTVFYNNKEVDPFLIDWNSENLNKHSYRIVQNPGPDNPLGLVKFVFPNKHIVYMHDTPSKKLFDSYPATFSSGCIRLSKAVELAKHILIHDKGWNETKIDSLINTGKTNNVNLANPLKIYITYFTAWVDKNGNLNFAPDIYKKDI